MNPPLRHLVAFALVGCSLFGAAMAAEDALLEEARALVGQGRNDAALARVERFLSESPLDERGRFLKGVLLVETGRSDEAIAEFKSLIKDRPELPEPYNNLAVLYAARGQYAEARDALLSAINTHPSYAIAHENLGDIYAKLAGIAYDKALSLDSSNDAARGKLALVHELFSSEAAPATGTSSVQVAAAPAAVSVPQPVAVPAPAAPAVVAEPVAMPVAAAEPVPAAAPAQASAQAQQAVHDAVLGWARAWSAKDVPTYLAQYGRAFQPPGGVSRSAWEAERRDRLLAPAFIEVRLDGLQIEVSGVDRARAVFRQSYRSDTYADTVRKVLGLAREGGAWRIVSEVSD